MAVTAVVGGSVLGAGASIFGASQQASAENKASDDQMKMYEQTRSDLSPYMQGGNAAFSQLQTLLGLNGGSSKQMLQTLQKTPGYQFALQQGQQGLDRTAAARGLELSGGQLKDSMAYNQGSAEGLYNNYANQLMGVSGLGENAAAGLGSQGTTLAGNQGNFTANAGTAMASGITGAANNIGAGLYQYGNMNPSQMGWGGYESGGSGYGNASGSDLDNEANEWLSDRRAKKDVARIGSLNSGLPVYSYKYRGSDLPQIGVMSDDVRRVAPSAVRRASDGFDRVDYSKVVQLPTLKRAA